MTNEEAQIIIGNIPIKPEVLDDCYDITEYQEAKTMAIKALEQQPFINKPCISSGVCYEDKINTLDKIKVEIDLKQYDFMNDKDYDEGIRFGLMLAYQIIDKYKAENEDTESTDKIIETLTKIKNAESTDWVRKGLSDEEVEKIILNARKNARERIEVDNK